MGEAKRRRETMTSNATATYLDLGTGKEAVGRRTGDVTTWLRQLRQVALRAINGERAEMSVPCSTCNACCYYKKVEVRPAQERAEDLAHLDTVIDPETGGLKLRKRADGACVHLTEQGCGVRDHRPHDCRMYDCRGFSMAGILDAYDGDRHSPVWVFAHGSEDDTLTKAAMQLGGVVYRQKNAHFDAAHALAYALENLAKHKALLAEMRDGIKAMPKAQQESVMQGLRAELEKHQRDA